MVFKHCAHQSVSKNHHGCMMEPSKSKMAVQDPISVMLTHLSLTYFPPYMTYINLIGSSWMHDGTLKIQNGCSRPNISHAHSPNIDIFSNIMTLLI